MVTIYMSATACRPSDLTFGNRPVISRRYCFNPLCTLTHRSQHLHGGERSRSRLHRSRTRHGNDPLAQIGSTTSANASGSGNNTVAGKGSGGTIVIGGKNFTEQSIMADPAVAVATRLSGRARLNDAHRVGLCSLRGSERLTGPPPDPAVAVATRLSGRARLNGAHSR